MDRDSAFGQVCFCGRQFTQPAALRNHRKTCKKSKNRLSIALAKAKKYVASRMEKFELATMSAGPGGDYPIQTGVVDANLEVVGEPIILCIAQPTNAM